MAYRDDLLALSARHDALAGEVARKTRELDDARRLLEQAHARARLPVLDNIRVAAPCSADWNAMTGDDRARHCGDCKKNVYNLSGMTREEAEALLIEKNGDVCVRYYQRHDGTILLADCVVGQKRRRRRRWVAAGAATLLAGGAAGVAVRAHQTEASRPEVVVGQMRQIREIPPTIERIDEPTRSIDEHTPTFAPTTPTRPPPPAPKMGKVLLR
jgi:hypothetical protein